MIITLASIPLTTIAEDALSTQDESINVNNQPNSYSLIEDMSKRDSFTKHYVAQDGSRYAVVFAEQVNYHDGEQWQEVDNRMTLDRASQMFAKNYSSNVTYTQSQAVIHVKGSEINLGGNLDESIEAINYYLSTSPDTALNLTILGGIYSSDVLKRFLDDGHVIYLDLKNYSIQNDEYVWGTIKHGVLIAEYTTIDGNYRFIVYDPWMTGPAQIHMRSYESICNSHVKQSFSDDSKFYTGGYSYFAWVNCLVVATSYSNQTVSHSFN